MRLENNEITQAMLAAGKRINVYRNGHRVPKCTMADEENGVIERLATDAHGDVIINEAREEAVKIYERGVVKVEIV